MLSQYAKHVYIHTELLSDKEINEILDKYNKDDSYDIRFSKKSYRKCDKMVINDHKIADLIWNKLIKYIDELTVKEGRKTWVPFCCSDRIKLIRYKPTDSFSWHVDASSMTTVNDEQYKVTYSVTIYLNTVHKKYAGATEFVKNTKIPSIQPEKGQAMILNTLYGPEHRGQELKGGSKYILRLDILAK